MKWIKFWGAVLIFILLLVQPEEVVTSAQRAMRIWYSSVAPALFPFLALMPMLSGKEACMAYEKLFSGWMQKLFHLPGAAAPAVIVGMIAGSPGGSIALREIAANSKLSKVDAQRIALAVSGVSPAFLITCVGKRLHGSAALGIKLAVAQAIIQLVLLAVLPVRCENNNMRIAPEQTDRNEKNTISFAVESILGICGYMVFYSVIAGALAGFAGKHVGNAVLLVVDLPSGLEALANSRSVLKDLLQGAAIGFTGLCIISQNMNVLSGLDIKWRYYIRARALSAAMLALIGVVMKKRETACMISLLEEARISYAASLFAVGISILPALYFLSKKLFLNKRKLEDI